MLFSKQISGYTSETTDFIAELKKKNPKLEEQQLAGRALLWDKAPINLDTSARDKDARVKQNAYVYQGH